MTTDAFRRNSDNFCYRHPDRVSFVLCQRCLRTICPECQTQGAVGVICPECIKDQQKAQTEVQRKAERRWSRSQPMAFATDSRPLVTYGIILVTAVVYVLQLIPGFGTIVENWLAFNSYFVWPGGPVPMQPWRLITVLFVHGSFFHMALNMLAVFYIGRSLEPLLGHWRYLVLYFLAGLGGSVAVALLAPGVWVVGASGAIFGLFGALLVIGRHIGANIRMIAIVIGINFLWPFAVALISSIGRGSFADALDAIAVSWQAHLGGLLVGGLVGFIYARTRQRSQRALQIWLLVGVAVGCIALLAIPPLLY
ncbi:rhomboid family intramembrane serine protease [Microbacterium sp. SS28]|uniref:rhomboid family intramembrane serine protease n=1 Tax=Microbacterium sp. SS28 TaxID=2919948 RepID=UPI001FAAB20E|nr:rhomboid family intramembrane serine protease [Microbacterium sp. SS28]